MTTAVKPPQTRAEMEDLVADICRAEIRIEELTVMMKDELQRVRERYEDSLTSINEPLKEKLAAAEQYVVANPDQLGSKKSIVMVAGVVGYRTGKPALKTLRGWTWKRVLDHLVDSFSDYVRPKPEVAKDMILADREKLGEQGLRELGLCVVREETFFVEPHAKETVTP